MINFKTEHNKNKLIVHAAGRLTINETPALESAAQSWYKNRHEELILNISNIDSIDSSGIGGVFAIKLNYEKLNRKLVLITKRGIINGHSIDNFLEDQVSERWTQENSDHP